MGVDTARDLCARQKKAGGVFPLFEMKVVISKVFYHSDPPYFIQHGDERFDKRGLATP
jgi:hypothetical protein